MWEALREREKDPVSACLYNAGATHYKVRLRVISATINTNGRGSEAKSLMGQLEGSQKWWPLNSASDRKQDFHRFSAYGELGNGNSLKDIICGKSNRRYGRRGRLG